MPPVEYLNIAHFEASPSGICEYINDALSKNKIGDIAGFFPGCITVAFGYRGMPPFERIEEFIMNLRECDGFILRSACGHISEVDRLIGMVSNYYSFRMVPRQLEDLDGIAEFIKPEGGNIKEMGEK